MESRRGGSSLSAAEGGRRREDCDGTRPYGWVDVPSSRFERTDAGGEGAEGGGSAPRGHHRAVMRPCRERNVPCVVNKRTTFNSGPSSENSDDVFTFTVS